MISPPGSKSLTVEAPNSRSAPDSSKTLPGCPPDIAFISLIAFTTLKGILNKVIKNCKVGKTRD